jgi:Carboxypeptidase regulatory-like domain
MNSRSCVTGGVVFAALGILAGCTSKGPGDFAHVSGTITHNGNPVEGAKVTFVSTTEVDGVQERFSTETDSSGKYLIAGVGKTPGIPPGRYKVVVTKLIIKPGFKAPEDFDSTQLEMSGMGVNSLPKEYSDVGTTKLSATLESGKNKDVNFELKGK